MRHLSAFLDMSDYGFNSFRFFLVQSGTISDTLMERVRLKYQEPRLSQGGHPDSSQDFGCFLLHIVFANKTQRLLMGPIFLHKVTSASEVRRLSPCTCLILCCLCMKHRSLSMCLIRRPKIKVKSPFRPISGPIPENSGMQDEKRIQCSSQVALAPTLPSLYPESVLFQSTRPFCRALRS